ncbi:DNA-binding transcriptional activator CadC [Serratia rubidaea]|nr:winged helix-turn-helix domain-containing protein [Serratia rubidaea]QPT14879.1 winged helix-turn-helix domain-containing protein [Serratia rubidaea]SQJ23648.1 DNA-binding transcriptional activator CadC [Serratia rubidaea]
MKYRINGQILFDTDSGSLGLEGFPEESLAISNPSKRLLLLLIAHHGEQVSRELIFRKVWDDYGMVSSNNNLNQCVSKLRRVLKTLGIDDEVIITVPKVGFMLAHNITLETDEPHITPPQSIAAEQGERRAVSWRNAGRRLRTGVALGALLLLVISVGIWLIYRNSAVRQERLIGEVNNCKVFLSAPRAALNGNADQVNDMLAYINANPESCKSGEYLLLLSSNQVGSYIKGVSRLFILKCRVAREYRVEVCRSQKDGPLF